MVLLGPSVFLMLVVGPAFLGFGLVFPCWSGVGPSLLGCGGWPCLLGICWPTTLGVGVGLSFFGWELVLSLWCGGCPFLLEVRPGPPFSGPSVFLMLVVGPSLLGCGGWPFLLGVRVGPVSLVWGLSLPSWGEGWPSLLGPVRLSHAGGWPFLLILLRVGVWPFLLRVWWLALPSWGAGFGLSFSG